MTREEMRIEVMAGRMEWPEDGGKSAAAVDTRSTRPELGPVKSWASGLGKRAQDVFRDGRSLPQWAQDDEVARPGLPKYGWVDHLDFHGWSRPKPAKYAWVIEREKETGEPWDYDYQRQQHRPLADMVPFVNIPPDMADICKRNGIEKDDPRYPVRSETTGIWGWPISDAGKNLGYGEPADRPDLHGMDYWADQARYGIVRPGQTMRGAAEEPGEYDQRVRALAARIDSEKGPGAA